MAKQQRILMVEDEPELAHIFASALEKEGFLVDLVKDGASAFEYLSKKAKPDLVLLDLVIPQIDGYAVMQRLGKDKVKNLSVYAWRNLSQDNEIKRAKKLGAKEYLIKSEYTPTKLVDKVKELLNK